MIAFLLGLMKIIGIVLLVLLIIFVLLVLTVLFVPIRYCAEGRLDEEEKTAKASVTWIAGIVRVKLNYIFPEKPIIVVKVFWLDIMKMINKPQKSSKAAKVKVPKELKEIKKQNRKMGNIKPEKKEKKKKEKYHPAVNIALLEAADAETAAKEAALEKEVAVNNEKSIDSSLKQDELTGKNKFEKIVFKITSLYDKIIHIWEKIEYYIAILEEEETQNLIHDSWNTISKILQSIRPKIFRLNAEVGFDSPETTGKVYGYYCMAMPWLGDDILVEPNFEEKVITGKLYLKGKIRLITILTNGLRIVLDKRLKVLLNKLKNGGIKNG